MSNTKTPTKTAHTPVKWWVDECPDASGFHTIRLADGSPNGDTSLQPVATVYEEEHAHLIASAPALLEALEAIERGLTNGQKDRGESFQSIARAAIAKAKGVGL